MWEGKCEIRLLQSLPFYARIEMLIKKYCYPFFCFPYSILHWLGTLYTKYSHSASSSPQFLIVIFNTRTVELYIRANISTTFGKCAEASEDEQRTKEQMKNSEIHPDLKFKKWNFSSLFFFSRYFVTFLSYSPH